MAAICELKKSIHYDHQCIHRYTRDDLGMVRGKVEGMMHRYCRDCLAAQKKEVDK